MPNSIGQITVEDFKAPLGKFRIMQKELATGRLRILVDFYTEFLAINRIKLLREESHEYVFTLCDENGPISE